MHRLERHILSALIRSPNLRYAELKPLDVESNLFIYHLKRLVKDGQVRKIDDGSYELTSRGKLLADKMHLDSLEVRQQPRIVLLLAARNAQGAWLLHRRKVQPVINMIGFLHANVVAGESIFDTATREFKRASGLKGQFTLRGHGYTTIYQGGELESYVIFNLLETKNPTGKLIAETDLGYNYWQDNPDFTQPDMIPSMSKLTKLLKSEKQPFFVELTYDLDNQPAAK